ncbi:MAG: ATP-NAD kinase family protein [Candidatus Bathyarchaeota archaeon]|nr:ATP-NAD kinase family protein [Candidatus Bathyarchaeota archaeon]
MKRLGLIVNPVAGMGGRVGLKGSDGAETLRRAKELGATETSPARAAEALKQLIAMRDQIELFTYPGEMGEEEARSVGFEPRVFGKIKAGETTSADTRAAASEMAGLGVDLLLFAGGDGTARDICEAIDGKVTALGIPTGVKIHSGVYAVSPAAAGALAAKYLNGEVTSVQDSEVMDIDEEAFRDNRLSARLYGYLRVPREEAYVQGSKEATPVQEDENLKAIAADLADEMRPDTLYVLGPGSTISSVAEHLGLAKTLLGVDVVQGGRIVASDVNEDQLLKIVAGRKAKIVVTVIGGQGFVFGRGNQQISPRVLRAVGRENIVIAATPAKLATLHGKPLLVDTGDPALDAELTGYTCVVTDYGRRVVYRIKAG